MISEDSLSFHFVPYHQWSFKGQKCFVLISSLYTIAGKRCCFEQNLISRLQPTDGNFLLKLQTLFAIGSVLLWRVIYGNQSGRRTIGLTIHVWPWHRIIPIIKLCSLIQFSLDHRQQGLREGLLEEIVKFSLRELYFFFLSLIVQVMSGMQSHKTSESMSNCSFKNNLKKRQHVMLLFLMIGSLFCFSANLLFY